MDKAIQEELENLVQKYKKNNIMLTMTQKTKK
jgi:hypothetical protein